MSATGRREVRVFDDANAMCRAAADVFLLAYQNAIAAHSEFRVALSGGSTPRVLHGLLTSDAYRDRIDWTRIVFFWGDERHVPPDHADSNYRMAVETLFDHVPVPGQNIHRMPTEHVDLGQAADEYQRTLAAHFGAGSLPRFDLILLGMGSDGHTASLFPQTRALEERARWVVANEVPQLDTRRMTLTFPVLNSAKLVLFTVAGIEKAGALQHVLEGDRDVTRWPSQGVSPLEGELCFLIDRAAASKLSRPDPSPRDD